jgi:hypothetical protein
MLQASRLLTGYGFVMLKTYSIDYFAYFYGFSVQWAFENPSNISTCKAIEVPTIHDSTESLQRIGRQARATSEQLLN